MASKTPKGPIRARVNKCRTDRYFLFTLNEYPQNFRLTGWRQSCDLTTFHAALSRINPNGTLSLDWVRNLRFGRWDYWLHGILLHNSGLVETLYDAPRSHPLGPSSSALVSCTQTGGEVFVLSDLRAIPQYIEAVNSKCHQGVVIDLIDVSGNATLLVDFLVPNEPIAIKQLVLLRENVKIPSFWPIPESFFPTEELLTAKLIRIGGLKYTPPISKAFERLGFQGVIKPEVLSRTFSFQFKNGLQRHQHCAQAEYEELVRDVSETESVPLVRVPKVSLPTLLEKFSELRAFGTVAKPSGRMLYENPCSVPRMKLRKVLPKLRDNLDSILNGVGRPMDSEGIHSQALSEMGDYSNYRYAQPHVAPLRELMPTPERVDTFGNPFRRKSNAGFVVDEVSVDDVGFSGPSPSSSLTMRKRSSIKSSEKARGPIPPHVKFSTLRLSKNCRSSPQRDLTSRLWEMVTVRCGTDIASTESNGWIDPSLPRYVGTSEMTSCHAVFVTSPTGYALGHLDGGGRGRLTKEFFGAVADFFDSTSKSDEALDVHIVELLVSKRVFKLRTLNSYLLNDCIVSVSGAQLHMPAIRAVVFDTYGAALFPASIQPEARGPLSVLRSSYVYSTSARSHMHNILDPISHRLIIRPFVIDENTLKTLESVQHYSHEQLQNFSTTPKQETDHFYEMLKRTSLLLTTLKKEKIDIFAGGNLEFVFDAGAQQWCPVNPRTEEANRNQLTRFK
ncbi:Integrator complex subunit 6 [Taenia crassiceps]|uniref:Integrator complex subunit 6 n=1 Tax=Taenia crassiceps TaxID=6207 RepID=A0ABR4QJ20_9CEST